MASKHTQAQIDDAREKVRGALFAADNANALGEWLVVLMAQAEDMLADFRAIDGLGVMEINPSNYDHELVCELSSNAVQAALIAQAAIARADPAQ